MKKTLHFYIVNSHRKSPIGLEAYVPNKQEFDAMWNVANGRWLLPGPQRDDMGVKVPESDPHLPELFALLKEAGWEPFYGEFVPPNLKDSRFLVSRWRQYEKKERDTAQYLKIQNWGGWEPIFNANKVENNLYQGQVHGVKWGSRLGMARTRRSPYFVRYDLKQELEDAGLIGLAFLPVIWDRPAKTKDKFWQISSSIAMPHCLLPILNLPEDRQPWTNYDDAGQFPQELVFRRSEVKAIEPFDVALTSPEEAIHRGPNSWTRNVVVSQRCRQVFKKLKLTSAELVPARLVSDDWQRPLSDHDRLRIDGL